MTSAVTVGAQGSWENQLITRKTESALLIELNAMGQEGWELVAVLYYKDLKGVMCWTAFVKRPATGAPPKAGAAVAAVSASAPRSDGPAHNPSGFDLSDEDFKLQE
jgi:hypothetical protein